MVFIREKLVEIEAEMHVLGAFCIARPAAGGIPLEAEAAVGKERLGAALDIADIAADILLRIGIGFIVFQKLIPLRLRDADMDFGNHRCVKDIGDGFVPVDIIGIVSVIFPRVNRRFRLPAGLDGNGIALAAARKGQGKDDANQG